MVLRRTSSDPDPVRASVDDLLEHLLALRRHMAPRLRADGEEGRNARHRHALSALGLALEWLMDPRMVDHRREISDLDLAAPLKAIADALADRRAGLNPELFHPWNEFGVSPTEATFKGRCAAIVELLRQTGFGLPAAADKLARGLAAAGLTTPRPGRDGVPRPIAAATILEWRKQARRGRKHPEMAEVYDRVVANVKSRAHDNNEIRRMAAGLAAGLRQCR